MLARRAAGQVHAGYWEFPGGKIEEGESPQESLYRELREELGLVTQVGPYLASNTHVYPEVRVQVCGYWARATSRCVELTVHDAAIWVRPADLARYQLAPADIPFVEQIVGHPYLSSIPVSC